jgi:hypothetical protein
MLQRNPVLTAELSDSRRSPYLPRPDLERHYPCYCMLQRNPVLTAGLSGNTRSLRLSYPDLERHYPLTLILKGITQIVIINWISGIIQDGFIDPIYSLIGFANLIGNET